MRIDAAGLGAVRRALKALERLHVENLSGVQVSQIIREAERELRVAVLEMRNEN